MPFGDGSRSTGAWLRGAVLACTAAGCSGVATSQFNGIFGTMELGQAMQEKLGEGNGEMKLE